MAEEQVEQPQEPSIRYNVSPDGYFWSGWKRDGVKADYNGEPIKFVSIDGPVAYQAKTLYLTGPVMMGCNILDVVNGCAGDGETPIYDLTCNSTDPAYETEVTLEGGGDKPVTGISVKLTEKAQFAPADSNADAPVFQLATD